MTRAILILTILFPATVVAQERAAAQQTNVEPAAAAALAAEPLSQIPPASPPASQRMRRRPSMVGYIEDGQIQSQVRFRFDTAFENSLPDRAEFFYAKCGCYQGLAQAIPQAFDSNAPGPGLGVPTNLNFQQLFFDAEYAPNSRISVFAELPARWIQPQGFKPVPPFPAFSSQGGVGDIRAGVKLGILSTSESSLTAQVRGYFPSGTASKGMGTNHGTIEPALLYWQQLSDRVTLESQIGDWHPTGGSDGVPTAGSDAFSGDVFFYGIGPSFELYKRGTVQFAPVVELVGWSVRGGFATDPGGPVLGAAVSASGTNIVNLKVGMRIVSRDRTSFYVGYGHALTDAAWYKSIVRLEYRFTF